MAARKQSLRLARRPPLSASVEGVGALLVVAAALLDAPPRVPLSALLGRALHMTWHVVDGADGDLARITGRSSPTGEMVDGLCDYASHIVLYLVLAWLLDFQIGHVAWVITVVAGA